jgi:tetratricopeptide (TPR) repeat protein
MKTMNARGLAIIMTAGCLLLVFGSGCESTGQRTQREASFHMGQAKVFAEQGLTDSTLAAFGLAIESNPNVVEAHLGMANIYKDRGDYALASRSYEQAAKIAPNSFDAHYNWGLMQQLLGKVEDAVRIYLRAVSIKPDSAEANEHLAAAYLQLSRPAEALPYAKRAAELQDKSQSAWANLGSTYNLLGRYNDAVDAYRRASGLGPIEEPILLGLAEAHLKLENWDRAAVVLDQLVRQKPSPTAHERLGFAQFKQRKFDAALVNFRSALAIDADDTASLNGLGVALMTLYVQGNRVNTAQRDEALAAWRRSVQLKAEQPRIVDLIARYQRL